MSNPIARRQSLDRLNPTCVMLAPVLVRATIAAAGGRPRRPLRTGFAPGQEGGLDRNQTPSLKEMRVNEMRVNEMRGLSGRPDGGGPPRRDDSVVRSPLMSRRRMLSISSTRNNLDTTAAMPLLFQASEHCVVPI